VARGPNLVYYYYYYYEIVHEVQKADFKQSTDRDGPKQLTNRIRRPYVEIIQ